MSDDWFFTEKEEKVYSVVEYLPVFGTIYSVMRASAAHRERKSVDMWQALANCVQSSIRDGVLVVASGGSAPFVIMLSASESLVDKAIEVFHREPKNPNIKLSKTEKLENDKDYVLVVENSEAKNASQFFGRKAKGVHYFHGSSFTGTLKHFYTDAFGGKGEMIRMDLRDGFYEGAYVTFSWKMNRDPGGRLDRHKKWAYGLSGRLKLEDGNHKRFTLSNIIIAGGTSGINIWGEVTSKDQIKGTIRIDDDAYNREIVFTRVKGT